MRPLFPDCIPNVYKSWEVSNLPFLRNHVFYNQLKNEQLELTRFKERVNSLTDGVLTEMVRNIPSEWRGENIAKMASHIKEVKDNSDRFIDEIRRLLT